MNPITNREERAEREEHATKYANNLMQSVLTEIERIKEHKKISYEKIAEEMGVNNSQFCNIRMGTIPTLETFCKMVIYSGLDIYTADY